MFDGLGFVDVYQCVPSFFTMHVQAVTNVHLRRAGSYSLKLNQVARSRPLADEVNGYSVSYYCLSGSGRQQFR